MARRKGITPIKPIHQPVVVNTGRRTKGTMVSHGRPAGGKCTKSGYK